VSRSLTAGMVTEVTASQLAPIVIIKAEFDGGDLRLWSGIGDLTYSSETYTGVGNIMALREITETTSLEATGIEITLSGIASSIIAIALAENYQGRPITVWFGALNNSGAIIADPYQIFKGRMDVLEIMESGETATVTMKCESRLIDFNRVKVKRYTSEDQKALYSGDKGCDFVARLQDQQLVWGRTSST